MAQAGGSKKKSFDQNIKVVVRVRPISEEEKLKGVRSIVKTPSAKEIQLKEKIYSYDGVFTPANSQYEVYSLVVGPMIHDVIKGYNCTVFAYGQTGSGKTYTMTGGHISHMCSPSPKGSPNLNWREDEEAGCIPRAAAHIFDELGAMHIKEYNVKVSFLELYNEDVRDLLNDDGKNQPLNIFNDNKGSVYVQNLTEQTVFNSNDIYTLLRKGTVRRQTASTLMNRHSSRSHTVFTITVNTRESTVDGVEILKSGKLYLVDLAGSENIGKSGIKDKRAQESANINRSLLTLGRIIHILADRNTKYVPYRDSKLTRILQDSLGGHTKTSIIATVSPAQTSHEETASTLDYALRARDIKNTPMINEKFSKSEMMLELNKEIAKLRSDLDAARSGDGFYMSKERWDEWQTTLSNNTSMMSVKNDVIQDLKKKLSDLETVRDLKEKQYEEAMKACKQKAKTVINKAKSHILQERFVANCYLEKVKEKTLQTKELCRDQEILHTKLENQYYNNFANVNMVKEKGSLLATKLNKALNILDRCKTDWRQTAGGLEQNLGEIREVEQTLMEDSVQNITGRMRTFGDGLHVDLETMETATRTDVFPHIARLTNGNEQIKSAVDDWAQITRQTSHEFTKHKEDLTSNVGSTVGNFCDLLTDRLYKLKEDKLSILDDLKRFAGVTENDLTVINELLGCIDGWKTSTFPTVFNSQLNNRKNTEEQFFASVDRKREEVSRMLDTGAGHLHDLEAKCDELTVMMSNVRAKSREEVEEVVECAQKFPEQFKTDLRHRFQSASEDLSHLSEDIDARLSEADQLLRACEHLRADLEKNIVPVVRAGDTPVVKQLTNPKRLSEEVPPRYALVKKYRDEFSEDMDESEIDLNVSFDAAIQQLNVTDENIPENLS